MTDPPAEPSRDAPPTTFQTTRWSVVADAAAGVPLALERLCADYREPLLQFVMRSGHDRPTAEDLVHSFFVRILENGLIKVADESRGRFRTFLLTSLKRYMINEWKRSQALKRGGALSQRGPRRPPVTELLTAPSKDRTADQVFEQGWAIHVLATAIQELEREHAAAASPVDFATLLPLLNREGGCDYRSLAAECHLTPSALRMKVSRLRTRLGELIRETIRPTVATEADVDDEILSLFRAFQ